MKPATLALLSLGAIGLLVAASSQEKKKLSFFGTLPSFEKPLEFAGYDVYVNEAGTVTFLDSRGNRLSDDAMVSQAPGEKVLALWKTKPKPVGADLFQADEHSNYMFVMPINCTRNQSGYNTLYQCALIAVDEYGRPWPGTYKYGGGSTFAGGIAYIVKTAAPYVAIAYPPAAPFIYAGLAAYETRGKSLSVKSIAISQARAQVPPEYQFAFDVGVGIANGKDPKKAAIDAYLEGKPEAKAYVEQGKKAYYGSQNASR